MTALPTSVFERALATSGLVPHEQVVQVRSTVAPSTGLATVLVEQGLLNSWQVDQLSQGRTKFSLGPYQIIDSIGRGGMGYVFKGRHAMLGRIEAIKVLPRERTRGEAIESFLREIRAQAQLDHPNVVRVSFADRDGETYYLVSEYVPGIDLRRLVRRAGPLPVDVAAMMVSEIAEALEYAHRRGLVHRDIKPGNVLVTPEGDVKLTDLGLAWRLDDPPLFRDGQQRRVVGTCDYLAPEAVQAPSCIMPVSDVYSLGCTFYYAVTGKVPYPGGNPRQKLKRVVRDEPIDPRTLRPGLPKQVVNLLSQLMHKNHASRTPSAAAAAESLRALVKPSSREAAAELVERFSGGAVNEFEGGDAGSDDTVDEPLLANPFPPSSPLPVGDASQATAPIASGDQETEPILEASQRRQGAGGPMPGPDSSAIPARRTMFDAWVWGTSACALIATALLVLTAVWRNW